MPLIALTTDFGLADTYVAQMKGVILTLCPDAQLVDVTHNLPPQDVTAGAFALEAAFDAFPNGTIHLAVVDPGVGSDRKSIAIDTGRGFAVGPDNGLLSLLPCFHGAELSNPVFHRTPVSATFHGRDIFAPVAAHLANGVRLDQLGQPTTPLTLDLPQPTADAIHVIHIDHFGNLITNTRAWPEGRTLRIGDVKITDVSSTFADVAPGGVVAYVGSGGWLEIAVRDGNASEYLKVQVGDRIGIENTD